MTLLRPITTETNQKFQISPQFKAYQYKDTGITLKVYTDNTPAFPITTSDITLLVKNSEPFNGGLTIWDSSHTANDAPFVGVPNRAYSLLTASSNNGTATIDVGEWDCTDRNLLVFVIRKTATTMTTGSVRARSSAGNEVVGTFDITSLSAGDYQRVTLDLTDNALYTGTPDISAITEVEIEIDVSGEALEIAMIYAVSDRLMIIGATMDLIFGCIAELTIDQTMDTADKLCKNLARDVFGTGRNDTIEVTTPNRNILGYAMSSGKPVKFDKVEIVQTVNSNSVVGRAISTNTIALPDGLSIWAVEVDGVTYQDGSKVGLTAVSVEAGFYFYDSSTGTMTFPTGLNGKIPVVTILNNQKISNYDSVGLDTGYEGVLYLILTSAQGRTDTIRAAKSKLVMATDTFNTDANDTVQFSIRMLADAESKVFTRAIE